jgi:aldose sugar dehydrogenase
MKKIFLIAFLALSSLSTSLANENIQIGDEKLKLTKVLSKLSSPWAFDFITDTEIIVNLKEGRLVRINLNTKKITEISGLPKVKNYGQGGLLDIRLAPDFSNSKKIYFSYSKEVAEGVTTAMSIAVLEANKLIKTHDIFEAKTRSNKGQHFGARITFDENYVFLSIGDRGFRHRAQMLDFHNGKIIRLNLDGTVPADNPFVATKDALPEIYSYGHRNPQGLFYDKETKKIWTGEHGPKGGDEVNHVRAGKNYGWPIITYGTEYYGPAIGEGTSKPGLELPVYYFVPSIAPCDLLIYSGKLFKTLKGSIFQGALKLAHMNILIPLKDKTFKEKRIVQDIGRVRSIRENNNGEIYFATDRGNIYKLSK